MTARTSSPLVLYVLPDGARQTSSMVDNGGRVTVETDGKPYVVVMRAANLAPDPSGYVADEVGKGGAV